MEMRAGRALSLGFAQLQLHLVLIIKTPRAKEAAIVFFPQLDMLSSVL